MKGIMKYLSSFSLVKIKMLDNIACRTRCEESDTMPYFRWECTIRQTSWRAFATFTKIYNLYAFGYGSYTIHIRHLINN